MTGVEILATNDIAIAFAFSWENFWIGILIMTILGSFAGLVLSILYDDFLALVVGFILGVIFGTFLGIGVGWSDGVPTEYETQYKVTISDEVPMNDFLDKYEIIDQEGKIYTVRERNG